MCIEDPPIRSAAARLRALGIALPRPPLPIGRYAGAKLAGHLLFVSGAYGTLPSEIGDTDVLPIFGRLGAELTVAEGRASARLVALNLLAAADAALRGLHRVSSVVRLVGYVNAAPGFVDAPAVLDGASQLLVDVFGPERGQHARMALYQPGLPGDAPLTAELLLEVDQSINEPPSESSGRGDVGSMSTTEPR